MLSQYTTVPMHAECEDSAVGIEVQLRHRCRFDKSKPVQNQAIRSLGHEVIFVAYDSFAPSRLRGNRHGLATKLNVEKNLQYADTQFLRC
ncbi:hypothetical protein ACVWWG_009186 [Bradyrhizobium sp. LB7.2]